MARTALGRLPTMKSLFTAVGIAFLVLACGCGDRQQKLDANAAAPADARRDLFEGMLEVARTGVGPRNQIPSIGCSIKWRAD